MDYLLSLYWHTTPAWIFFDIQACVLQELAPRASTVDTAYLFYKTNNNTPR